MLKFMDNKYGERATQGDKSTLMFMRTEAERLEELVNEKKEKEKDADAANKSEKGSEMETDEDVSILPFYLLFCQFNPIMNFCSILFLIRTKTIMLISCRRIWPRNRSKVHECQYLLRLLVLSIRRRTSSRMSFRRQTLLSRQLWRRLNRLLCSLD
jgi:hypothetical protein